MFVSCLLTESFKAAPLSFLKKISDISRIPVALYLMNNEHYISFNECFNILY